MNTCGARREADPTNKWKAHPFGHLWWVATHKEDVPPEEMQKRVQALFGPKH